MLKLKIVRGGNMYIDSKNQSHEVALRKANLKIQSEINQPPSKSPQINIPEVDIPWVGVLSFIAMSWASIFLILSKLLNAGQNQDMLTAHLFHTLPCRTCKFFCNNHYLKCAVHPDIVMTEQARNCSDYCPKSGNNYSKNLETRK